MRHFASSKFWTLYRALPEEVRELADKSYQLLKSNPRHPSLHFKKVGELWSVRVGDHYRALGVVEVGGINWIWIGTHAEYDKLVSDMVWSSLDDSDTLSLPQWQRDLLDERLASIDTEEGRDWEDVKAEVWPAEAG